VKKTVVVFGLGLLLFGLSLGQVSGAQMASMSRASQPSSEALQQEIKLLKVINRAALTKVQLEQLQTLLSGLREAQQNVVERQQALKTFLLSWQGKTADFSVALMPFETKVEQAKQALQREREVAVAQLKDQWSYRQGETFFTGLNSLTSARMQMASGNMMQSMMQAMMKHMQRAAPSSSQGKSGMQMGNQANTQNKMMPNTQTMQGQSQMGAMMGQADWGLLLSKQADLLGQMVAEKLASLSAQ